MIFFCSVIHRIVFYTDEWAVLPFSVVFWQICSCCLTVIESFVQCDTTLYFTPHQLLQLTRCGWTCYCQTSVLQFLLHLSSTQCCSFKSHLGPYKVPLPSIECRVFTTTHSETDAVLVNVKTRRLLWLPLTFRHFFHLCCFHSGFCQKCEARASFYASAFPQLLHFHSDWSRSRLPAGVHKKAQIEACFLHRFSFKDSLTSPCSRPAMKFDV